MPFRFHFHAINWIFCVMVRFWAQFARWYPSSCRFRVPNYTFRLNALSTGRNVSYKQSLCTTNNGKLKTVLDATIDRNLNSISGYQKNIDARNAHRSSAEGSSKTLKRRKISIYGVPIALLFIYLTLSRFFERRRKRDEADDYEESVLAFLYGQLPLNAMSRALGRVCNSEVPVFARPWIYGAFMRVTNVDINEASCTDLLNYSSLSAFFQRRIRPELRPVDNDAVVVSPCDGKVLRWGVVKSNRLYQVKNARYRLSEFLGEPTWRHLLELSPTVVSSEDEKKLAEAGHSNAAAKFEDYIATLKTDSSNELYYINLYLAPGDYHRFHSPADWTVHFRRHFPGKLLSVREGVVGKLENLYSVNERAVYVGKWQYGFYSMSPVGATGVGNILIPFDEELVTNTPGFFRKKPVTERKFESAISLKKGDEFGSFNFGSTIVLIFEAPSGLEFAFDDDHESVPVRYGQPLLRTPRNLDSAKK